jgi:hypothetical protein
MGKQQKAEKFNKKKFASMFLLLLLSGNFSVDIEASKSSFRVRVNRQENSLMKLFDWFNP